MNQSRKYVFQTKQFVSSPTIFAGIFLLWGVLAYCFSSVHTIWFLLFNAPLGLLNIFVLMKTIAAPIPGLLVLSAVGFGLGWALKAAKQGEKWGAIVIIIFALHTICFAVGTALIAFAISQNSS
jgi:hypothetical protein